MHVVFFPCSLHFHHESAHAKVYSLSIMICRLTVRGSTTTLNRRRMFREKPQPGMLREKEKLHQKDGLTNDLMLIISISRSSCPNFLMLETTPLPGTIRPQSLVTLDYMHVNTSPAGKWKTLPLLIFLCNQLCCATLICENLLYIYIGAHLCTLSSTPTCCCLSIPAN